MSRRGQSGRDRPSGKQGAGAEHSSAQPLLFPGAGAAGTPEPWNLTGEQRRAVDSPHSRLISASAGTGKTHTLTAIYTNLLFEHGLHPGEIVAVTFSDKAAAELRSRVHAALTRWLEHGVSSAQAAHLRRCLQDLPGAPVNTIHGFCASLLREAGASPGAPAGFTILDEETSSAHLALALTETAAEMLEEGEDAPFMELAREWGVTGAYGLGLSPAGRRLVEALRTSGLEPEKLQEGEAPADSLAGLCEPLQEAVRLIRALPDSGRSRPSEEVRQFVAEDLTPKDLRSGRQTILQLSQLIRGVGKDPLKWAENAGLDERLSSALVFAHAPYRAALASFLARALLRYRALKRRGGGLDFDDLLLEAQELLKREPARARPYRCVLIDEFQDTNPVQKEVLFRLAGAAEGRAAGGPAPLIVVGDMKQSIYRFRGADVSLMGNELAQGRLAVFHLQENFRSRRATLNWINAFCATSLWPEAGEAAEEKGFQYDEAQRLLPSMSEPDRHQDDDRSGELLLAAPGDESESVEVRRWRQAEAIARRIRTLVDPAPGTPKSGGLIRPRIWDKPRGAPGTPGRWRKEVRYGDIAVLARSLKHMRAPLELAFSRYGIPFRMQKGVSFYTRQEVLDVLNLLACVAHPEDRAAWIGFLRSPFVLLSDGGLFLLVQSCGGTNERSHGNPLAANAVDAAAAARGLEATDAARFRGAVVLWNRLRAGLGRFTAAETIDLACAESGFLNLLALQPQGETRVAAVRRLIEISRKFEGHGHPTLGDFAAWLREKANADWEDPGREGGPELSPDLPETSDYVQAGTVHWAKGLEFPITIVAELGQVSPSFSPPLLLLSQTGQAPRLGLKIGLAREGLAPRADAWHARAHEEERKAEVDESKRILYVALTRARDYLILCGEASGKKGPWRAWVDAYDLKAEEEGTLPRLARVSYEDGELLAARPAQDRAPLRFEAGRLRWAPPAGQASAGEREGLRALLAGPARPPTPAPGTERDGEVTVTELAHFLSCPRRFAWQQMPGAEEEGRAESQERSGVPADQDASAGGTAPSAARAFGIAAHAALEAAFACGDAAAATGAWRQALCTLGLAPEDGPARAVEPQIGAVLASAWALGVLALPSDARFVERPFRWRVALPGGRAATLSGTLDLLARGGAGAGARWQVVDYKLAALDRAAEDGPAREAWARYAWQAGLYALAAAQLLGEKSAAVEPALLPLYGESAAPIPLGRLPFASPAHPAVERIGLEALSQALSSFLESQAEVAARGEEALGKVSWPPGAVRPEERSERRCRSERCPFVTRCFAS